MTALASTNDALRDEVRGVFDRVITPRTKMPIVHGRDSYSGNVQQHVQLVVDDAELVHDLSKRVTHH